MSNMILTLTDRDVERFWAKVDKNGPVPKHCPELGPCWVWTASTDKDGYGWFGVTVGPKKTLNLKAHRIAWMISSGAWPGTMFVCHHCDNPSCVRVSHMFIGTLQDNVADMVAKQRHAFGERNGSHLHPERRARGERSGRRTHPETTCRGDRHWTRLFPQSVPRGELANNSKLTSASVIAALEMLKSGMGPRQVAEALGVSRVLISKIRRGDVWKHITR